MEKCKYYIKIKVTQNLQSKTLKKKTTEEEKANLD
jgi:hypothetical protein